MFDKIKGNLKEIIATVAIIGTIGGGFIKYGEIMSKIDSIDPAKAGQIKQELAIAQKEIELLKVQMKELRASSSNPLARWVIRSWLRLVRCTVRKYLCYLNKDLMLK